MTADRDDRSPKSHRVDRAQTLVRPCLSHRSRPLIPVKSKSGLSQTSDQLDLLESPPNSQASQTETHHSLLHLHAEDLFRHLQEKSADLDAREAKLNARDFALDQRERQFRMQRQQWEIEYARQQKAIDRLRSKVDAHFRSLALEQFV